MPKPKITYTLTSSNGNDNQIDEEDIRKYGIEPYAESNPGATIRMRDSQNEDYDIPLQYYNDAVKEGLHPFRIEHRKASQQEKQPSQATDEKTYKVMPESVAYEEKPDKQEPVTEKPAEQKAKEPGFKKDWRTDMAVSSIAYAARHIGDDYRMKTKARSSVDPSTGKMTPLFEYNPTSGKFKQKYGTITGELASSPEEAEEIEKFARYKFLTGTEEGKSVLSRRQSAKDKEFQDSVENFGRYWDEIDGNKSAERAWNEAEEKTRAENERSARSIYGNSNMMLGREMHIVNASELYSAKQVNHMRNHDIDKLLESAWNNLGKAGQQKAIDYCYKILARQYGYNSRDKIYEAAKEMARQQSDIRMYNTAVEKNMPKSNLEYLARKIASGNSIAQLSHGISRSKAGTIGDMQVREVANSIYEQGSAVRKATGIAGTVLGFAFDPLTILSAGTGSASAKGAAWVGGKILAGKAATPLVVSAATRQFATTNAGRILTGMAAGAGNFGTYELAKEGLGQFQFGGHINPDTGKNEGYSLGKMVGAGAHGTLMGAATGWISPVFGSLSDRLAQATTSTAGKLGVRAGQFAGTVLTEGTIFSIPEWIEGSRDAMDVWTDNQAMMLGFKGQHTIKTGVKVIGDMFSRTGRVGFETKLRQRLDGNPSLRFTEDEKRELSENGYGDILELVKDQEMVDAINASKKPSREIAKIGDVKKEFTSHLQDMMSDNNISEAARAKMYYLATGRTLPMSTVMSSSIEKKGDKYIVASYGANGVITSRSHSSKKSAEAEMERINRTIELNYVSVGERFTDSTSSEKAQELAMSDVALIYPDMTPNEIMRRYKIYKGIAEKERLQSEQELIDWVDAAIETRMGETGSKSVRNSLNEEYGVNIDKVLAKEPNRRTAKEREALGAYIRALYPEGAFEQKSLTGSQDARLIGREMRGEDRTNANFDFEIAQENVMQYLDKATVERLLADPEGTLEELRKSPTWNAELESAVMDAIKTKAVVDGIEDNVQEETEKRIIEAEHSINTMTNVEDGMVHPAKNAVDGSELHIVSGNVVTREDGTIDREASDDTIVVVDKDGNKLMVPASSVSEVEQPIPADQLKEESAANIRKEYEQSERDQINGVVTPRPGMVIPLQGDGSTYNVTIVGEDGHGNVVVDMGGQQFPIPYDVFQEAAKTAKLSERKAYLQEQAAIPVEQAEAEVRQEEPYAESEVSIPVAGEAAVTDEAVASPEETQTAETPSIESQDKVPYNEQKGTSHTDVVQDDMRERDKDGNLVYEKLPVAETLGDLYQDYTTDEVDMFISEKIGEAENELRKAENKKPKTKITNKTKYLAEKREIEAEMEDAVAKLGYWNEVKENHKIAIGKFSQPESAEDQYNEPVDAYEYVASKLGAIKITPESYRRETGAGSEEQSKMVGIIASEKNGGVSIERASEILVEDGAMAQYGITADDQPEVRNIIIDVLSYGNPRGYIKRSREARRRAYSLAEANQLENMAREHFHMSGEDYLAYEESRIPEMLVQYQGFDENLFNSEINDLINQRNEREQHNKQTESEVDVRSSKVLPDEQPYDGKREEDAYERNDKGKVGTGNEMLAKTGTEGIGTESVTEGVAPKDRETTSVSKPAEGPVNDKVKAAEADTDKNPTEAQKEAGNYKKGHVTIGDFDITIENPAGSTRSGKDANGKDWSVTMANTYGYLRGTEGADGDHIDVFLSNDMDGWNGGKVFVVDQKNTDGSFDEHKCMIGFNDIDEAEAAYYANYSPDWRKTHPGIRITGVSIDDFNKWIASSHRKTKPFAEYSAIKPTESKAEISPRTEGYSIEARKDTRDDSDIYAVKFDERVTKDEFKGQKAIAKKFGGYWSNFGKKGFLFKTEEAAHDFAETVMGRTVEEVEDEAPVSIADIGGKSPMQKIDEMAMQAAIGQGIEVSPRDFAMGLPPTQHRINIGLAGAIAGRLNDRQLLAYFENRGYHFDDAMRNAILELRKSFKDGSISLNDIVTILDNSVKSETEDNTGTVQEEPQESKESENKSDKESTESTEEPDNPREEMEHYEELKNRMRAKLNQLNSEIDPELMEIGEEMAFYNFNGGMRRFSDFCKTMINDCGEGIRPHLKMLYNAASETEEFIERGWDMEMDDRKTVREFDVYNFDKRNVDPIKYADHIVQEAESIKQGEQAIEQVKEERNKKRKTQKVENNDKEVQLQSGTGIAEREGGHEPQQNAPLGESKQHEAEGTDGRGMVGRNRNNTVSDQERSRGVSELPDGQQRIGTQEKNSRNNVSERGTDYAPKGENARIEANLKAIETMNRLVESGEEASREDMEVMRRFSGWGGLGGAFKERIGSGPWSPENHINKKLREILTPEQYEWARGNASMSQYFTPAAVIDKMWDIARALGFKGGNVLEGSAGIGNIIGLMPRDLSANSDIHAVEVDDAIGQMLSLLYPDAKVDIKGFEKAQVPNGSVDLSITNVPFVTGLKVYDESGDSDLSKKFRDIHNFCIAKNVRKLREGGIGIFISSSGTLDGSPKLIDWITNEGKSDVVGAFRLNSNTFGGTNATSDIIVVRKRINGKKSANAIDVSKEGVLRVVPYLAKDARSNAKPKELALTLNQYFIDHPEYMGGDMAFAFEKGETWQETSRRLYPSTDKNQDEMLDKWVKDMQSKNWEALTAESKPREDTSVIYENLGEDVKEGTMLLDKDDNLCIAQNGLAVPLDINSNKVKGQTKEQCFKDYKAIKDALADVLDYQANKSDDKGLEPLLKELNRAYDNFVKTYGHFYKNTSISFLKNDMDYPTISALEDIKEKGTSDGKKEIVYGKTDVFKRRVVEKESYPNPTNVKDGIIASIYNEGFINIPYISEHLGKSEEEVREEIKKSGLGFENPISRDIEVSYEYLSGNVREKLAQAIEANTEGQYDANIKALEQVIPMNIPAHLIDFTLGSSWVNTKLYTDYVKDKTGLDVVLSHVGGTWVMKAQYYVDTEKNKELGVRSEICQKQIYGHQLIEAAMKNKTIKVEKTENLPGGETQKITDKEASLLCANKIEDIRNDFKDWAKKKMQNDPELSQDIERIYNEQFNNYVPKEISKEFIPDHFGGQARVVNGKEFHMREHQAKAAIRATTQPLLLAHEVGTGKTYTLITAAMEMRRLGTARKPMIVVQNATIGQFVKSAKSLYPNARILSLDDRDKNKEGRKNFFARIRYNDWDMIVVTQSAFEKIPDSPEREARYIQDKIDEKMKVLEELRINSSGGKDRNVSQAERELDNLYEKLNEANIKKLKKDESKKLQAEAKAKQNTTVKAKEMLERETDDTVDFDEMGIDALLIDEAHSYKHLGFETAMQQGVKGVDPSFSKRSQGLYLKTRSVFENSNGRNVVFATGTPISNTAAEIWTFMRYLMPEEVMKEYDIFYFDDFARNFGLVQQTLEFNARGNYKEANRFMGYINLPELVRIWSGVTDTVLTNETKVNDEIPKIEGGKAQDIFLPQSKSLRSVMLFVKSELERFDQMSGKEKRQNRNLPLDMFRIAKFAAVDPRLVLDNAPDEPYSKTNETVRQTLKSLEDSKKYKGTVAIFCDIQNNKRTGFNIFEDIQNKLIAKGVPSEQIAIIQSKTPLSDKKKEAIFEKVNNGEIRVIMGSTGTLGTGVNIQNRLHTLINIDAPVRPMDYTQRLGRILRQGNLHKDMGIPVRILRFGVEDSLDVTAYQRLKTKGAIADSIMNGKKMIDESMTNRTLEEEEDVFGDITAQLSGSQYALLKNQTERQVKKLEGRKRDYEQDQIYIHNQKPRLQGLIKLFEDIRSKATEALKKVESIDNKEITIGKIHFKNVEEMTEYIKSYNSNLRQTQEDVRSGNNNKVSSSVSINIGGIDFVLSTHTERELKRTSTGVVKAATTKMKYSSEALGLKDVPVEGNKIKNALNDIIDNVLSGKDSRETIEGSNNSIALYKKDIAQLEEREGKPFAEQEELDKANERLYELENLMQNELAEKEAKYSELDKEVEEASDITLSEEDTDTENVRFRDGEDVTEYSDIDTESIEEASSDLASSLGKKVRVVRDTGEITHADPKVQTRMRNSKGWYNTQTGEVVVVLPNAESIEDVEETILHEVVGHEGMREIVGEDKYDQFLDDVFLGATKEVRAKIIDGMAKNGFDAREATDEYIAHLSEEGFKTREERNFFQKIYDAFMDLIRRAKIKLKFRINDNDLRYMLWRSYKAKKAKAKKANGKEDVFSKAEDIAMQNELGVGNYRMRNVFGGNSGYVGYSMSNRAYSAKEEGRYPKTEFRKVYNVTPKSLDLLVESKMIDDSEWHHTSSYGNRTTFYEWGNELYPIVYLSHKKEIDNLSREFSKPQPLSVMYGPYIQSYIASHIRDFASLTPEEEQAKNKEHESVSNSGMERDRRIEAHKEIDRKYDSIISERIENNNAREKVMNTPEYKEYEAKIRKEEQEYKEWAIRRKNILERIDEIFSDESIENDPAVIEYKKSISTEDSAIRFRDGNTEVRADDKQGLNNSGITPEMAQDAVEEVANKPKTISQSITDALVQLSKSHKDNLQVKKDALAEVTATLNGIRKAKSAQKAYDKSTVQDLATLATTLIRGGFLDKPSSYEISRIIAAIKNGSTSDNIQKQAEKIEDVIISNQLRACSEALQKLSNVKSKINASGVEIQGGVDARSKSVLDVFRNVLYNKNNPVTPESMQSKIADAEERMGSEDSVVADNAAIEWEGLNLANRYMETVQESMTEENELRAELSKAKEEKDNGSMTSEAYKEFVESTKEAIRSNQLERIDSYVNIIGDLYKINKYGREAAKEFIQEKKARVKEIQHNANSDMTGVSYEAQRREEQTWEQKLANNSVIRFFMAPMATFDQMLRMFGSKNVNGEGYLFNRFIPQSIYASGKEFDGIQEAFNELDGKVSEIYGRKMKWADLYTLEKKVSDNIIPLLIHLKDELKTYDLSQGNALYIYMANKMPDGMMKLRKMGITQSHVDAIVKLIDPRFIELADWLQEYFMPKLREKYNDVHKRMFGIPMADIENYYPLKILSGARDEQVDVSENMDGNNLPSTVTSSVIKRRRNSLPLDILNTDAFSLAVEHIQEMEHWAAFAEFNRDINTLLSYKRFKNKVLNMTSMYGSGKMLWDTFFKVSQITSGQYKPIGKKGTLDSFVVNIAKNVTAAKISFRVYTAIKQLLSLPSFATESDPKYLAKSILKPVDSWNWCMENIPLFRKRWKSRQAGDPRLKKTELDWKFMHSDIAETMTRLGMTPNAFVDALTVSIGTKAIYDSKKEKYISYGYNEEQAEEKAKMDATISFNETQQSSENMFLSPMQTERTVASVSLTVFRNSSMGYQRQLFDAIRNIYRRTTVQGYKDMSIEFMTKQNVRNGLSEEQALYAAKKDYGRALFHDLSRMAMFGFILQFAWNIGAYLPYILFGDDDDKKDEMLKDAAIHGLFGSTEGLTAGNILSESLNMIAQGKSFYNYDPTLLPALSDTKRLVQSFGTDYVEGVNGIVNLLIQGAIGVNPQSITETAISIYDACGGDVQTTKEATIFAMRVLNVPQSQIDQVYIDEINLSAREAQQYTISELASRYAKYRLMRGSTSTMWMYDEEGKDEALERHKKRFEKHAKERIISAGDKAINESFNKYLDEFVETRKQYTNILNYKNSDTDKYAMRLEEFMNTPEGKRYAIMMRATRILNHLAGIMLDTKDPEVINSLEEKISSAKEEFVYALESTEQP